MTPIEFCYLPTHLLRVSPFQPRQDFNAQALHELAQSIASQGLIEPLVVRPIAKEHYEIIAGERRWRAAQSIGMKTVPCLLGEYNDKQACTLILIENIQRENLNSIEEAVGYQRLIEEFHYHQEEVADLVGKSRSHVTNMIRLLTLSDHTKALVSKRLLSFGHARALVGLSSQLQQRFSEQIIKEQWSVRQLEQVVKKCKTQDQYSPKNPHQDRDIVRLQDLLADQLGTPVQIESGDNEGGWLKVKFFNNDTLAGLLERLGLRYD